MLSSAIDAIRAASVAQIDSTTSLNSELWGDVGSFVRQMTERMSAISKSILDKQQRAIITQLPANVDPAELWRIFAYFRVIVTRESKVHDKVTRMFKSASDPKFVGASDDPTVDNKFRKLATDVHREWEREYVYTLNNVFKDEIAEVKSGRYTNPIAADFTQIAFNHLFDHMWYTRSPMRIQLPMNMPWLGKAAFSLDHQTPASMPAQTQTFLKSTLRSTTFPGKLVRAVATQVCADVYIYLKNATFLSGWNAHLEERRRFGRDAGPWRTWVRSLTAPDGRPFITEQGAHAVNTVLMQAIADVRLALQTTRANVIRTASAVSGFVTMFNGAVAALKRSNDYKDPRSSDTKTAYETLFSAKETSVMVEGKEKDRHEYMNAMYDDVGKIAFKAVGEWTEYGTAALLDTKPNTVTTEEAATFGPILKEMFTLVSIVSSEMDTKHHADFGRWFSTPEAVETSRCHAHALKRRYIDLVCADVVAMEKIEEIKLNLPQSNDETHRRLNAMFDSLETAMQDDRVIQSFPSVIKRLDQERHWVDTWTEANPRLFVDYKALYSGPALPKIREFAKRLDRMVQTNVPPNRVEHLRWIEDKAHPTHDNAIKQVEDDWTQLSHTTNLSTHAELNSLVDETLAESRQMVRDYAGSFKHPVPVAAGDGGVAVVNARDQFAKVTQWLDDPYTHSLSDAMLNAIHLNDANWTSFIDYQIQGAVDLETKSFSYPAAPASSSSSSSSSSLPTPTLVNAASVRACMSSLHALNDLHLQLLAANDTLPRLLWKRFSVVLYHSLRVRLLTLKK